MNLMCRPLSQFLRAMLPGLLVCGIGTAAAQGSLIYTCTASNGKKLTSDRAIPECIGTEQRVLNSDGSLNRIVPPTLTAEEASAADDQKRKVQAAQLAQREAEKRDRTLLARYPNEAVLMSARDQALDDPRKSLATSEQRLIALAKERKPLNDEAEFYVGKPFPLKLKLAIDANDAAVDAVKSFIQVQKVDIDRIEKNYDGLLAQLRLLWAGARPGTIGPVASASTPGPSKAARP